MSRRFSTSRQGRLTLDLSDLRTLRYIQAQPAVRKAWNNTTTNYEKGKQLPALGIFFVWFEMYSSWLWKTVHAVPYPEFMIHMVYQIDDRAERALDYTVNQAEWIWELSSIRLMEIQEKFRSIAIRQEHVVGLLNQSIDISKEFALWYINNIVLLIKWTITAAKMPLTRANATWSKLKEFLDFYTTKGISTYKRKPFQQQKHHSIPLHQQQQHQHQQKQHQQHQLVDTDDEVEFQKTDSTAKHGSLRRLFQKSDKGSDMNGSASPATGATVNGESGSAADENLLLQRQRTMSPTNGHRSSSLKRFPRIFSSSFRAKDNEMSSDGEVSTYGGESPVSSAPGSPEPSQKLSRSSSFFGKRKQNKTSAAPTVNNSTEANRRTFSLKGQRK